MDYGKLKELLYAQCEADEADPKLKELKQRVRIVAKYVASAEGVSIASALCAQNDANLALYNYLVSKQR